MLTKYMDCSAACAEAGVAIRWMIRRDMPRVLDIEMETMRDCWYEEDFLGWLTNQNCIGMVAERGDEVVGYMLYRLLKHRIHVLRFAVDHAKHRQGIGTAMAAKLIQKLSLQRRSAITLDVADDLLPMHLFLRSCGFVAASVDGETYRFVWAK